MSWLNLSDNLSNLSGNFSSITGQISNFTREVLTESTEEVFDQDAELKLAKIKIKDLEIILNKQRGELERINGFNEELREKADSAELQMQAMSLEYRNVIDSKEREIKDLKSLSNETKNEHSLFISKDEMDYEDSEFFHMTVDRLKSELEEVRVECQHWKEAARNQNNQAELQRINEEHQHEIASLQSMYTQRISQMNKKHKSELEDLISENEQLAKSCSEKETEIGVLSRSTGSTNEAVNKNTSILEEKCKKLTLDFEIKKKQLENLQSQMLEEKKSKKSFEEENSNLREEQLRNLKKIDDLENEIELLSLNVDKYEQQKHEENPTRIETNKQKEIEELDRMWRTKFDGILQDLNEARDENVELSLELSQYEEKFQGLESERNQLIDEINKYEEENKELRIEKENLEENTADLQRLKNDISRLSACTVDLLEELEFQKGLSGDQNLEIESLRKICTIKGSPAEEIKNMQKSLKELGGRYVELYIHYKKVSFELRKSNDRLLAERQLRHTTAVQLREEISSASQRLRDTAEAKLHACAEETDSVSNELTDLNRQVGRREKIVSELESDVDFVSDQTEKIVSEFGCQVKQSDIIPKGGKEAETIDSLIAEKEILERTIEGLERKAGALEELVASLQGNKDRYFGSAKGSDISTCNSDTEQDRIEQYKGLEYVNKHPDVSRTVSTAESIVSTDGFYIDDEHPRDNKAWPISEVHNNRQKRIISELETTVLDREKELFEMSTIKKDLEFEKSTLEKVVFDLQKQLKSAKETSTKMAELGHNNTALSHQGSVTDVSSLEWDSLMEARDETQNLKVELEQAKKEIISTDRVLGDVLLFLSKGLAAECSQLQVLSSDKASKVDGMIKERFSWFSEEIEKLKLNSDGLRKELSDIDKTVEGMLWFVFDAWEQRAGRKKISDLQNKCCQEKLDALRSVLENFIMECSGETDADKWRSLHDEVIAEKASVVEELSQLKDSLQVWKNKHRDLSEENTSLLETVDLLRQDLELMSQGQSALAAERELLQTKAVDVEELSQLKDSLQFWKNKHRDLSEENTSLLETVDLLRQDLELMSQGQSALAAERELLQTKAMDVEELSQLKDSLQFWKNKHRDLSEENTSLLETVDLLRQDLELMSQGQSALAAERELLQTELDKLQFQIDTNETDDSKEIGELKMQLDDLKAERERIMRMVNERDDFITEQQEKHDCLVEQIVEEKDRDLLEIQEQLEETMKLYKDKQKECEELNNRVLMLEESFKDADTRVFDLKKVLTSLEKERDSLQCEVNDRRFQAKENEVLMKSLEQQDEELREKEIVEEDMIREQEMLIEELRSENVYLKNAINNSGSVGSQSHTTNMLGDISSSELNSVKEKLRKEEAEKDELKQRNNELMNEIGSLNKLVESLKLKLAEVENHEKKRTSPTIELNSVNDVIDGDHMEARDRELLVSSSGKSMSKDAVVVIEEQKADNVVVVVHPEVNNEEKMLVHDYVKQKERLRELELEIEAYKGYERMVDEKDLEIDRYKSEVGRMMQVLRAKDELLLNLEMMEGESANNESPFSSRARVIQYIRDKEMELGYTQEKMRSLEELIKNNAHQLELLKVERQNLLILLKTKEAESIDLNERLENTQARSAAKERASAVLHSEHQKLLELNNSQGSEIARLRERNQYLQNVLQDRQSKNEHEKMLSKRNEELEIQVSAFQQEQERLLTLIHEKDKSNLEIRKTLNELQSKSEEDRHVLGSSKRSSDVGNVLGNAADVVDAIQIGNNGIKNGTTSAEMATEIGYISGIGVCEDNYESKSNEITASGKSMVDHTSGCQTNRTFKKADDFEKLLREYKQKIDLLNANNLNLSRDNDELKQKLELVDNEKRKLEVEMDNELHEKDVYSKDCAARIEELKNRIVEITHNFEKERTKTTQNYETGTSLLTKEWNEKLSQKEEEIKSLKEKIELLETYRERIENLDKTDNKTVSQIDILTSENRKLRTFYDEKSNELSVLQADLHRLKNYASASEAALNKIQADNRCILEESQKKDKQIEDLLNSKNLASQRIQELETEVHRLMVNCREIEAKAAKEMERFRNHLITIEESYTNEAVTARDRETELEQKVNELQGLMRQRRSEFEENSNQSSFQIQNLQQQLIAVASQRDNAITRLSEAQEKARQNEASLVNLQMALEHFQKEKDSQYELLAEQSTKKLMAANKEVEDLRKKEHSFHARIQEANLAVQGVANLSNEVKTKEDQIETLKKQVANLETDVDAKSEFIKKLKDSTEGKIEKPLMKNLLLGYFHTPEAKRPEVVRVIGNLVGLSQEEIAEVGNGAPPSQRTWVSNLIPFAGGTKPLKTPARRAESRFPSLSQSFSEMFVSFLEEESGAASKSDRPTANQLTSLLMQTPASTSNTAPGRLHENKQPTTSESSILNSNPLLITPQDARAMHSTAFKTTLPFLPSTLSSSTPLFPAPGQEIPKVHTSTANSALRTMLSK